MRVRFAVLIPALAAAIFMAGCCPMCPDPAHLATCPAILEFEHYEADGEALAVSAFALVKSALPPDKQAPAQTAFDDAKRVLDTAMTVFVAGIAANDAGRGGDVAGLLTDVSTALFAVINVVVSFRTAVAAPGAPPLVPQAASAASEAQRQLAAANADAQFIKAKFASKQRIK